MRAIVAAGNYPVLLAHQGGWDEALLIGTPILVIVGLLALAKKRVDAALPEGADSQIPPDAGLADIESESTLDGRSDGGQTTD